MYPRPWILTGAGISTESGIPDFRSSGGLWEKVDPIQNFSTWALYNNPTGFFTYGMPMFEQIIEAKPNKAHLIVGELQAKRFLGPIITQNVDSLHQRGGAKWVYEVHGHIRTATCINCRDKVVTMEELFSLVQEGQIPPKCDCGGILKPDVILFGDAMPEDFQDAINLIRCHGTTDNMIIVIGSSLTVSPINSFPFEFEKLAIINNSPTALDGNAEIIISGSASEIMQQIKDRLIELNNNEELQPMPPGFMVGRLATIINDMWEKIQSSKNNQEKLSKLMGDIILVEKLLTSYPNLESRQGIEKYLIDISLKSIQKIKRKLPDNIKPMDGYIPRSLNDIINSHYKALALYVNQDNWQSEIVQELMQQILGLIGLYRYMGALKIQRFEYNLVDELVNKILGLANQYKIIVDVEKGLNGY
ncbi:MAG: hypothetical protein GX790_02485 [Syntrophomonadaceae bacterium]|nr:hypothetical protein [Syntrophomonadaceae bacterium]